MERDCGRLQSLYHINTALFHIELKVCSKSKYILICCISQGKCSVIKALDLHCPPGLFGPKKVTFEDSDFNLFGKGRRSSVSSAVVWKKELEQSFKQPFSFANNEKKVDEHDDSDSESDR